MQSLNLKRQSGRRDNTFLCLVGLLLLSWLLFLLALPLGLLAFVSLDKLHQTANLNHLTLELLLIWGTVAGLLSPAVFYIPRRSVWGKILAANTMIVAVAFAALFSPLYQGFIH